MEFKELSPTQVTTTRDFPVHSVEVLKEYFEIFKSGCGEDLPPVPIMHRNLVIPHLEESTRVLFQEYLRQNPQAEYFLLNGSHRTTSANLTRYMIKGILLATEEDIQRARQIKINGAMYNHGLNDTIGGNIKNLVDNFRGIKMFQTVQQKTDRMANERVIPQHMIERHRNSLK